MSSAHNRISLDCDDERFTIRVNGKLVVAYPRAKVTSTVLEVIFLYLGRLIRHLDSEEYQENCIFGLQLPSVEPCTLCGKHRNLLGGLCRDCTEVK